MQRCVRVVCFVGRRLLAGGLVLGGVGCVTLQDGERMKNDIAALKDQTASLQRTITDQRAETQTRVNAVADRLQSLEHNLVSLRQADADGGVQLDHIISEVQSLRGQLEDARHQLGETKATIQDILAGPALKSAAANGAPEKAAEPPQKTIGGEAIPADPQGHYEQAKRFLDDKRWSNAVEGFDTFLQRYPKHALAPQAAFGKAEALSSQAANLDGKAREKAYKDAILAYQQVLESPKAGKSDVALFKIGLAFEALGFKDEASVFYEELVTKHKDSAFVVDAKKHLKALKTSPKSSPDKGKKKS